VTGSPVVIDASVALKLVLPDPLRERCRTLITHLMAGGSELVAPALWAYETTSTLCKAIRFEQLTLDEGRRALVQITELGVRLVTPDAQQNRRAFEWTVRLKRAAAYDSYYLALAETLTCDFWTADRRLSHAVDLSWLRWAGEFEA
jgi:predicted nucleic acid-binding protein